MIEWVKNSERQVPLGVLVHTRWKVHIPWNDCPVYRHVITIFATNRGRLTARSVLNHHWRWVNTDFDWSTGPMVNNFIEGFKFARQF